MDDLQLDWRQHISRDMDLIADALGHDGYIAFLVWLQAEVETELMGEDEAE